MSLRCSREFYCPHRNPLPESSASATLTNPAYARSAHRNAHAQDCDDDTPDSPTAARHAKESA